MLYPKQQECVNQIIDTFNTPNHISNHRIYLSGEMGVGKTYIASSVADKLTKGKRVLIVCPTSVVNKWQKVFTDICGEKPIIVTSKNLDEFLKRYAQTQSVSAIISETSAYRVLGKLYSEINYWNHNEFNTEVKHVLQWASSYERSTAKVEYDIQIHSKKIFDLTIFDELHTYKPTRKIFGVMGFILSQQPYWLGLTGTIFNQNLSYLAYLIKLTHSDLLSMLTSSIPARLYANDSLIDDLSSFVDILSQPAVFTSSIWKKIAVQINLKDVQTNKQTSINQKIMPLHGIKLRPDQQAWLQLATLHLHNLQLSESRINHILTSYIDLPTQAQESIIKNAGTTSRVTTTSQYLPALALKPIALDETPKYKQLVEILTKSQKTIVFVQDAKLIKLLVKLIPKSFGVPISTRKQKVVGLVANQFKYNDVAIMSTKSASVGIDLNMATRVIWYQVPYDVATILQAQRRVLRLNSTKSSQVYFLFYDNTMQSEIISQVSKSAIRNAAVYNIRDNSSLAKITTMLFEGIDQHETH